MKRLKGLRIGAKHYKVRYRRPNSMPDALGLHHYDKPLIDIRTGQQPLDEKDSVVHEVFHGILASQGREYGGNVEETYVRALATGLVATLQANPEFAEWLCSPIPNTTP